MNTNTKTELAAVTATQSAVDAMAVVTLSPEKYAAEVYQPFNERLAAAIEGVKAIDYDIKTTAGMAVAVKARATFRDLRTEADNERKERKAPITKIGKLLESHFDMVEERARPLEALFDADIQAEVERKEAEKAAKIAAERARTEAIQAMIQKIRSEPVSLAGKTADEIAAWLDAENPDKDFDFMEFSDAAADAIAESLIIIRNMLSKAQAAEAAALAAEEARLAEAARIEQERATLAAQRAENERIANEQAAERQRLANLAAAQEAGATRIREKAAGNLKAEQDALAEQMRIQREAAAEQQRQLEAKQAEFEAQRAAFAREQEEARKRAEDAAKMEVDHAEALEMNASHDALAAWREQQHLDSLAQDDAAADLARCTATAQAMLTNGRSLVQADADPMQFSVGAYMDAGLDESELTDDDITELGAQCGMDKPALIVRLRKYIADSEAA